MDLSIDTWVNGCSQSFHHRKNQSPALAEFSARNPENSKAKQHLAEGQGGGGGSTREMRLQIEQDAAARAEREVLNLKMEVAHLRERLRARVGGDTTAVELEAENATLRAAAADAEQEAARREAARCELEAAHAKAMLNLVKLDGAWKQSAEEARAARDREKDVVAALANVKREHMAAVEQHTTEMTAVRDELEYAEREKEAVKREMEQVKAELDDLMARHERARRQAATDIAALEDKLRDAVEANAALRGETQALREEREDMEKQLAMAKHAAEEATARSLHLKEELATSTTHLEAAKHAAEMQSEEVERLRSRLNASDDAATRLERQLSEQVQRATETAETNARKVEQEMQTKETEWTARLREIQHALTTKETEWASLMRKAENDATIKEAEWTARLREAERTLTSKDAEWASRGREAEQANAANEAQWMGRMRALERKMATKEADYTREWQQRVDKERREAAKARDKLTHLLALQTAVERMLNGQDGDQHSKDTHHTLVVAARQQQQKLRELESELAAAKTETARLEQRLEALDTLAVENDCLRAERDRAKKTMEWMGARTNKPATSFSAVPTPSASTKPAAGMIASVKKLAVENNHLHSERDFAKTSARFLSTRTFTPTNNASTSTTTIPAAVKEPTSGAQVIVSTKRLTVEKDYVRVERERAKKTMEWMDARTRKPASSVATLSSAKESTAAGVHAFPSITTFTMTSYKENNGALKVSPSGSRLKRKLEDVTRTSPTRLSPRLPPPVFSPEPTDTELKVTPPRSTHSTPPPAAPSRAHKSRASKREFVASQYMHMGPSVGR